MSDPTTDLATMFKHQDEQRRWKAERENASARLELAQIRTRLAEVLSQHQPVASLDINRDDLRKVIDYIRTGRIQPELAVKMKGGTP
jgi:hypothetical protein